MCNPGLRLFQEFRGYNLLMFLNIRIHQGQLLKNRVMRFLERVIICADMRFFFQCALSIQSPLIPRFRNPNRFKIINKINTKVNNLLCSVRTGDASLWMSTVTNTFLQYTHEPLEGKHVVQKYRSEDINLFHKVHYKIYHNVNINSKPTRHCTTLFYNFIRLSC